MHTFFGGGGEDNLRADHRYAHSIKCYHWMGFDYYYYYYYAQRGLVLSQPVHRMGTYRCDDTRGFIMQF
jgi:hypothetical protein